MLLSKLHIFMPKSHHKESRLLFINEAKLIESKVLTGIRLIPEIKKYF